MIFCFILGYSINRDWECENFCMPVVFRIADFIQFICFDISKENWKRSTP